MLQKSSHPVTRIKSQEAPEEQSFSSQQLQNKDTQNSILQQQLQVLQDREKERPLTMMEKEIRKTN